MTNEDAPTLVFPNAFDMDQAVADYITANTPISPAIQGRVKCVDANPGSGNDCPAGSP